MKPVIGLPKGKYAAQVYRDLAAAGIDLVQYGPRRDSLSYLIETDHAIFLMDTTADLVRRVALGDVNMAIVGDDHVREFGAEYASSQGGNSSVFRYAPEDLHTRPLSRYPVWRLAFLARNDASFASFEQLLETVGENSGHPVLSWTEFPYTELERIQRARPELQVGIYPHSSGQVLIFPSSRTTESKIQREQCIFGLETVSTGNHAAANDIRIFEETATTQGMATVQPSSYEDPFVKDLVAALETMD